MLHDFLNPFRELLCGVQNGVLGLACLSITWIASTFAAQ